MIEIKALLIHGQCICEIAICHELFSITKQLQHGNKNVDEVDVETQGRKPLHASDLVLRSTPEHVADAVHVIGRESQEYQDGEHVQGHL